MDEIKLWKIGGSATNPIISDVPATAQTKTEERLEEILVKAPNLLSEGLKLVGRQVETSGGATLDLLGVSEDGQLIVFELKRGTLTRDAVAQIIDYGSFLAGLSPSELSLFVSKGSGKFGVEKIDDFEGWYEDQFAGKSIETIGNPRMVLVGLGVDDRAKRMVEFLATRNIDISLMTFHGFDDGQETYLAKQIEVPQKTIAQSTRISKQTNLQALERRIQEAGVKDFFTQVAGAIRSELSNSYEWPNQSGYGYYFQDVTEAGTPSNRVYITLSVPNNSKGALLLTLYERAIQAAGLCWSQVSQVWADRIAKKKGYFEVKISSQQDWQAMGPDFRTLCASILQGRKEAQEQRVTAEQQEFEAAASNRLAQGVAES
jgi:hypothetical protein